MYHSGMRGADRFKAQVSVQNLRMRIRLLKIPCVRNVHIFLRVNLFFITYSLIVLILIYLYAEPGVGA